VRWHDHRAARIPVIGTLNVPDDVWIVRFPLEDPVSFGLKTMECRITKKMIILLTGDQLIGIIMKIP
jgi:hypothetical protein